MFGKDKSINLVLFDIPQMADRLESLRMEIQDMCCPNITTLKIATSYKDAFMDADGVILLGGYPRKKGMLRKDLISLNAPIFKETGEAISKYSSPNAKILVVANPANTNALVLLKSSKLPPKNITALSFLDSNRLKGLIANKFNCENTSVSGINIWGNHSTTLTIDCDDLVIYGKKVDEATLLEKLQMTKNELSETIRQRGARVIEKRGLSSAMSAAKAINDHMRKWFSPGKNCFCMAVYSDGNPFQIADGIFYSFPVVADNGEWLFDDKIKSNERIKRELKESEKELIDEKNKCDL
ncbi:Malate dehydrogenase, cytoplasmic, variant 2 [Bonamia ostreae]